jgi:hypothetical protein
VFSSTNSCDAPPWKRKSSGIEESKVNTLAIDHTYPDTIYAGTDDGIYVSFDDAEHGIK